MERIIKFRVWDLNYKGWMTDDCVGVDATGQILTYRQGGIMPGWIQDQNDDFIVQRFTGLLDGKGKEIYEGDILDARVDDEIIPDLRKFKYNLLVYWNNRNHTWAAKTKNVSDYECETFLFRGSHYEILLDKSKIIGNIMENPELLK